MKTPAAAAAAAGATGFHYFAFFVAKEKTRLVKFSQAKKYMRKFGTEFYGISDTF